MMSPSLDLLYGDASHTIRLEFPDSWAEAGVAAANIAIANTEGTALLGSAACTVTTASTLSSNAVAGTNTIVTAAGVGTAPGDRLWIAASALGRGELVTVDYYDSATKSATLTADLQASHSSGAAVRAAWCTYAANLSSASTYPLGSTVVITWTPGSSDQLAVTALARIVSTTAAVSDLWARLEARWPAACSLVSDARRSVLDSTLALDYRLELSSYGLDPARIVDSPIGQQGLERYAHYQILTGAGDDWEYELGVAKTEWTGWLDRVRSLPIWQDTDQDAVESSGETCWDSLEITERWM